MYSHTLRNTAALNKPSAFDRYLAGFVLAGIQDQEWLRGLPPAQRDRATKALCDLDVILHSSSEQESHAARERLTQALAGKWSAEPKSFAARLG